MWKRRLTVLGIVLILGSFGLYLYLGSSSIAQQVRDRLKQMLRVEVGVASARIGIVGNSTAQDVTVHERDQLPGATPPLVRVADANLGLSLFGVLGAGLPSTIDLNALDLYLRFAETGALLTGFPDLQGDGGGEVPPIRIRNGSVTLDQRGRDPLKVGGADVRITREGPNLAIKGTVAETEWGGWEVEASYLVAEKLFTLRLTNPKAELTMDMLRRIPFISPNVWTAVEVQGTTGVDITLRVPIGGKVSYKVVLAVTRANLTVPSIDLRATEVRGDITIEDSLVTLDKVSGRFADGKLVTSGALDFRTQPSTLRFQVEADDLDLVRLPKSYKLPEQLQGRFDMKARIEVETNPWKLTGSGDGDINHAAFANIVFPQSIPLKLTSDGRRFRLRPTLSPLLLLPRGAVDPEPEQWLVWLREAPEPIRPAEVIQQLGEGVFQRATTGIEALRHGVERLIRPRKPDEELPYLEADTNLDDVDLLNLTRQAGLHFSVPVEGRVSFRVRLGIPLEPRATLRDYRLLGRVGIVGLRLGDTRIATGAASLRFADGLLTLDPVSGLALLSIPNTPAPVLGPLACAGSAYLLTLPTLRFDGAARIPLDPPGEFDANLTVRRVPLDRFLAGLTGGAFQPSGVLTGHLAVKVPVSRIGDFNAWTGRGVIEVPRFDARGVRLREILLEVRLGDSELTIPSIRGNVQGAALTGSGRIELAEPYSVGGTLRLDEVDLALFPEVPPEARGRVSLQARLGGDLRTTPTLSGRITSDHLLVAGFSLDDPVVEWRLDRSLLRIDRLAATFFDGSIRGKGTLPLSPKQKGEVDLKASGISLGALARQIPGLPLRIGGSIAGELTVGLDAVDGTGARSVHLDLNLTAPRLSFQDLTIHGATGRLRTDGDRGSLTVQGELLGADIRADGTYEAGAWQARGHVKGLRLDRLDGEFGGLSGLAELRGVVDFDFDAGRQNDDRQERGTGRILARGFGWQGHEAIEKIQANLVLDGPILRVTQVEGRLAGGLCRLGLGLNFRQIERSWYDLRLSNADLPALLGPLVDLGETGAVRVRRADGAEHVLDGVLNLTVRGNLGREWRGEGTLDIGRGKVLGADLDELRLPFAFAWSPLIGAGSLTVRESTARLARGTARGGLQLTWRNHGRTLSVEGGYRILGVELGPLLNKVDALGSLGSGRIGGRVDFVGQEIRSLDDLVVSFEATMSRLPAFRLPVLSSLVPFLRAARSESAFDGGTLRGRLRGGVVQVEGLYLRSDLVRLAMTGTLTMTGRLDLDALALVGPELFPGPALVGRVPRVGPLPTAILEEATRFLTTRVVRLSVGGSVRSPSVRAEPLRSLSDELVRFFTGTLAP